MIKHWIEDALFTLAAILVYAASFVAIAAAGRALTPGVPTDEGKAIIFLAAIALAFVPARVVVLIHALRASRRVEFRVLRGRGGRLLHRKGI